MYKEVLRSIDNIAIWPVISFVIFFAFFLLLLWRTFWEDMKYLSKMSNLPLDDEDMESEREEVKKINTFEISTNLPMEGEQKQSPESQTEKI